MKKMKLRYGYCLLFFAFFTMFLSFASEVPVVVQDVYVDLNKQSYNIADFIIAASKLDADKESPLFQLQRYISDGYLIGMQDDILQVFEYARWLLEHDETITDEAVRSNLLITLDDLTQAMIDGNLNVDDDINLKSK